MLDRPVLGPDKPQEPIVVTLPDGATKEGIAWKTTAMDIARDISKSLSERVVIAKVSRGSHREHRGLGAHSAIGLQVDGELYDLLRPLEASCEVEFLDFDHSEGKMVFWHSSAHVLGEACEKYFGCFLSHGPPLEEGFYYDMGMKDRCAAHPVLSPRPVCQRRVQICQPG
jgi:threonyl-tRNA synthetase